MQPYKRLPPSATGGLTWRGGGSGPATTPACAACRTLRRRCTSDCLFAPYFPPDQPQRFINVHRVFGVANVSKLLKQIPERNRDDCVQTLVFEANMRVKEPVYGIVQVIASLEQQITGLQAQLARAHEIIVSLASSRAATAPATPPRQPPRRLSPLQPQPVKEEIEVKLDPSCCQFDG